MADRKGCRYAVIRFCPYQETEEFANVGLLLTCPKTGYWGFKLEEKLPKRLGNFFSNLDSEVYKKAILHFKEELLSIQYLLKQLPHTAEQIRTLFEGFVHPRESIIRFSTPKAMLHEDPEAALDYLFDSYVNHSFATPSYQKKLNEKVNQILMSVSRGQKFYRQSIGNDSYKIQFPFVDDKKQVVINPIYFPDDSNSAGKGYEWIGKINRLEQSEVLKEVQKILFAFEIPEKESISARHRDAIEFFSNELSKQNKIKVIHEISESSFSDFLMR